MRFFALVISLFVCSLGFCQSLELGLKAPDFDLIGLNAKAYNLDSFKESKILAIVFTCNHCPTAQAYENRLIEYQETYKNRGVQLVAISPNNEKAIRLDELGYTDLNDSYEEMKIRAKDKNFNFPYLYDGLSQKVSKLYKPAATPHVFLFDQNRTLRYKGRIDNNENPNKTTKHDLIEATEALLNNKDLETSETKTLGCSIKWSQKISNSEQIEWAKEPVSLTILNIEDIKPVVKANGKYHLINLWATWCGPCVREFSELVNTDKMYRNRDFVMSTISLDHVEKQEQVLDFLSSKFASNKNYIFKGSQYDFIDAFDPEWEGGLPYTILLSPEGEIIYRKMGEVDIRSLRKLIVSRLGRYYF